MTAVYFRLRLRDQKWGQKKNTPKQKKFFYYPQTKIKNKITTIKEKI